MLVLFLVLGDLLRRGRIRYHVPLFPFAAEYRHIWFFVPWVGIPIAHNVLLLSPDGDHIEEREKNPPFTKLLLLLLLLFYPLWIFSLLLHIIAADRNQFVPSHIR